MKWLILDLVLLALVIVELAFEFGPAIVLVSALIVFSQLPEFG